MNAKGIESATLRAERLLIELCPDNTEFKKLTKRGRSQEKIGMIRQAVELLLTNAIPTSAIAKALKISQASVQFHARWLEKNGVLIRPSKYAHWLMAKRLSE
jgi:biotin operon repressor